jgi:hypothetical protein
MLDMPRTVNMEVLGFWRSKKVLTRDSRSQFQVIVGGGGEAAYSNSNVMVDAGMKMRVVHNFL